jgi:adenosylmethionine-8-amino-7-oxononanoate aminotransferase
MKNTDNLSFDREHIWHPYSSVVHPPCIHEVVSADGVRLRLNDGREIIDGMSSWWSAIHGYNHPRLNQAVKDQVETMSHVMFGGLTHPPAVELARKLVDITAEPLQKVFFADSGSIAVEVAIKMAIQYWFAQGKNNKHRLLTLRNGYHGDTFGTMAVCDPDNGMHGMFDQVLAKHLFAPSPNCINDDDYSDEDIAPFRQIISENHHQIAAVILEPIVQNAGGMNFYCPEYLRQVRALCDQYDVLLILDEIATNFGRTGTLFAYEQADICPDIICLGKSLTAGYMTLAATMCTDKLAQGIAADGSGILMHGPTFMGNPLACSVASESIDILLESDWQGQVKVIEQQLLDELLPYQNEGLVKSVRVKGAIGVVELHQPIDKQMSWLPEFIVDQGVWIRPFRNLIYIMPPYIISSDDLRQLTAAVGTIVQRLSS